MYQFGSETKELRAMYNFGSNSDDGVAPPEVPQVLVPPTQLEDINMHSDDEEKTVERQQSTAKVPSPVYSLPGQSAFASELSRSADKETSLKASGEVVNSEAPVGKHRESSKVHIVKEVLGLNAKSTNGLTPAEKEHMLLEERWKNAMAEEARLNYLDEQIKSREQATVAAGLLPNFPPKFLCIRPLVHHDISIVPEPRMKYVRLNFMNWIATSFLLLINMFVVIIVISVPYSKGVEHKFNAAQSIVLSILYLLGGPLSFVVWYWQVYVACCTGRHTRHILSLSGLVIALGFTIFMILGKTNLGACGISLTVDVSHLKSKFLIIPLIVVTIMWVMEALLLCYCIMKQWVFYRLDINAQQEVKRQLHNVIGI